MSGGRSILRPRSLGLRLLVAIVLFSTLLTLVTTALQLLTEYRWGVAAIEERLTQVETSYAGTLEHSLWSFDERQLQTAMKGIVELPDIEYLEVETTYGERYTAGAPPDAGERILTRAFTLRHTEGRVLELGSARVTASLSGVLQYLEDRFLVILATEAVTTFLVALFVLVIFQYLVTRHLGTMASYARGLRLERLDRPLVLHRKAERRAAQDELDEVTQALNEMRLSLREEVGRREETARENARLYREAREAIRLRDEFLTVASHELRTPLTSLGLQAQRLERLSRDTGDEEAFRQAVRKAVGVILRQLGRLQQLVETILEVSQLQSGGLHLSKEPVDLGELTRGGLHRLEGALGAARCPVDLQVEGPVVGRWDRQRLEQVVLGLVGNALKFGAGRPIKVRVASSHGWAWLLVRDEGIGIPKEDQARIFDRFTRGVSERHFGGLGLGLFVSQRIVEAHGGHIRVESEPGAGATFILELPLQPAPAHPAPPEQGEAHA